MIHLDTNIVIACLRGDAYIADRIERETPIPGISSLVAAELILGAHRSARTEKNLEQVHDFLSRVHVVPFDFRCAEIFAELKAQLMRDGLVSGEVDMMIAATSITHTATLITRNRRHFESIPKLLIEDWLP